ncbi:response regulator [Candidatus Woesearchaeota archaeon]|nr:response regulator [Candidatus Woesearchaeota archaeon]
MPDIQKILQLEDEEVVQDIVKTVLERKGIEIELVINLEQAMQALDGLNGYSGLSQYDALLLDMMLPDGKGSDIAKKVRELGFQGRIVMFSGRDMQDAKEQTQDLDNIGYLNKPTRPKNFIPALEGTYSD